MAVKVQIPPPMRQHTEGKATVEVEGTTVQDILEQVGLQYPSMAARLFEDGKLRRFVNILLNNEDIRYLDSINSIVKDGDEVEIMPAVSGG